LQGDSPGKGAVLKTNSDTIFVAAGMKKVVVKEKQIFLPFLSPFVL
jgi:hypothetical protein